MNQFILKTTSSAHYGLILRHSVAYICIVIFRDNFFSFVGFWFLTQVGRKFFKELQYLSVYILWHVLLLLT